LDAAGRLVVAVAVQKRLALQRGRLPAAGVLAHELCEVVGLLAETLRVLVVRPELHELVLDDGDAARLDPDHRSPRPEVAALRVGMSTETGQSFVQPLQERQRSSASSTSLERKPSSSSPFSISHSVRARPRVVCFSSRVTMKLGHMTPLSVRRHLPIPTQRVVACAKEPWSFGNAKCVLTGGGL